MEPVMARLNYVVRGESAVFNAANRAESYWPIEEHIVPIHDVRPLTDELSFDRNGFVLAKGQSAVPGAASEEEMKRLHAEEAVALITRLTGADKVVTFGTMLRTDAPDAGDGNLPAFGAHVDYGARTVRDFTLDLMPEEEADRRLKGRHMLINIWRPLRPVERTPLALCDASTVLREDMFPSEVRGGLGDAKRRSLWGFNLAYNPDHRWYYAPHMQPDEAYVFRLYDSDPDAVQFTGHSAFDDPRSAPDALPRQSIEIRTIAYLG
jgi:hypothetical protein